MSSALLSTVTKCSQLDNRDDPGARCTEAVATMIDCSYQLGPKARMAQTDADRQAIMYDFVAYLGGDGLKDFGKWFPKWLDERHITTIQLAKDRPITFGACKQMVDAGHVAVIQVDDYLLLKGYDGKLLYLSGNHVGHVLLLVGYNDDFVDGHGRHWGETVVVHDPLRKVRDQPWDYSYQNLKEIGAVLWEVNGPSLKEPPDPQTEKANLQAAIAQLTTQLEQLGQERQHLQAQLDLLQHEQPIH